jgi:hypothetical protein
MQKQASPESGHCSGLWAPLSGMRATDILQDQGDWSHSLVPTLCLPSHLPHSPTPTHPLLPTLTLKSFITLVIQCRLLGCRPALSTQALIRTWILDPTLPNCPAKQNPKLIHLKLCVQSQFALSSQLHPLPTPTNLPR